MRAIPILLALAVTAALWFWVGTPLTASDAAAPPPGVAARAPAPVPVVALRSEARDIESFLLLRGRTEAARLVEVKAETPGLVISDPLRAGASVAEAEPLCRLDPGAREVELAEARARLLRAEAEARAAETLSARGIGAENTAIARRAELQSAQATVQRVELDIARLEIRAPFAGVLETDAAELGALLRVGDTCARLIALDPIKLTAFVSEAEVDRLSVGDPAYARLVTGRQILGAVSFVSRAADPATRTFRVEITAPNPPDAPEGAVRDGMTVEIAVPLPSGRGHLVPQAALSLDDAGRLGVRVVEDGRARFHEVRILREDRRGLWLGDLPESAEIIFVGHEFVADGRPVSVTYEDWDAE